MPIPIWFYSDLRLYLFKLGYRTGHISVSIKLPGRSSRLNLDPTGCFSEDRQLPHRRQYDQVRAINWHFELLPLNLSVEARYRLILLLHMAHQYLPYSPTSIIDIADQGWTPHCRLSRCHLDPLLPLILELLLNRLLYRHSLFYQFDFYFCFIVLPFSFNESFIYFFILYFYIEYFKQISF